MKKFLISKTPFIRSVDLGSMSTTRMMYDYLIESDLFHSVVSAFMVEQSHSSELSLYVPETSLLEDKEGNIVSMDINSAKVNNRYGNGGKLIMLKIMN